MAKQLPELTPEQIDEFMECLIKRHKLEKLVKRFGFSSMREYNRFCKANPSFKEQADEADILAARILRDEIEDVTLDRNPKEARVHLEALKSLLVYLDPRTYNPKIDLNVNQTISIRYALDRSHTNLLGALKDVTPLLVEEKKSQV